MRKSEAECVANVRLIVCSELTKIVSPLVYIYTPSSPYLHPLFAIYTPHITPRGASPPRPLAAGNAGDGDYGPFRVPPLYVISNLTSQCMKGVGDCRGGRVARPRRESGPGHPRHPPRRGATPAPEISAPPSGLAGRRAARGGARPAPAKPATADAERSRGSGTGRRRCAPRAARAALRGRPDSPPTPFIH